MSRRSVAPLLIGTFILRVNGGAGNVVLGLFLAGFSTHSSYVITSLHVGLLAVAFFSTELALAPLMGALSDRWGRQYFLIIGPLFGLMQVTLILFTPVRSPLLYLLFVQMLAGISAAMQVPAVLGYLADYTAHEPALRMRVMSLFELATSGGIAVGVVLGGIAWDRFGRFAFALLALLYLAAAVCMLLAPKARQIIEHGNFRAVGRRYWRIIRTRRLFIFIPAWICISALAGIWLSSQITFILSKPHHDPHQLLMGSMAGPGSGHRLSLILGGYVLFFGLCLLFWAFFLNHTSRLRLMLTSIAGVYIACIALAAINHRGSGNDALLFVWMPLLLVGVFAESSFAPAALAYLADLSGEAAKDRGLLMGLYSIFLGLGQLVGNGLGGVFARIWGFDGLIYLTALLGFIALIFLLMLFKVEKEAFHLSERTG